MDPTPAFCAGSRSAGSPPSSAAAGGDSWAALRRLRGRSPAPQGQDAAAFPNRGRKPQGGAARSRCLRRDAGSPSPAQSSYLPWVVSAVRISSVIRRVHSVLSTSESPTVACRFTRVFFLCEVKLVGRSTCFKITGLEVLPFFLLSLEFPLFLIRFGAGGGETNSSFSLPTAGVSKPWRAACVCERERLGRVSTFLSALK